MDISKHPILKQAYDLSLAIEDLGTGDKITEMSFIAAQLIKGIESIVDSESITGLRFDIRMLHKEISRLRRDLQDPIPDEKH